MEGVGARFGRSSNRYTTTTVFTGPVRKWKKKWVQLTPSASAHHHSSSNGNVDGANGSSPLLMFKWTPVTPSRNKDGRDNYNGSNGDSAETEVSNKDNAVSGDEPPRRKFKFIPVAVLEAEQNEDESKPIENEIDMDATAETDSKIDEKPDINDEPINEIQASEDEPPERHDLNKSSLDLSLGLKSDDREHESAYNADQVSNDQQT